MINLKYVALLLSTCVLWSACINDTSTSNDNPGTTPTSPSGKADEVEQITRDTRQHTTTGQSWTYMVYMMGDNNLEPYALEDLMEMATAGSTEDVNIVVLSDRSPNYTADGVLNLEDWEDSKYLHVQHNHLEIVHEPGELDLGNPKTLVEFVQWTTEHYPADRYALSFWDHGGSWNGGFGPDDTTIHQDSSEDGTLHISDLQWAFDEILASTPIEVFGFIGFDTCLLGNWSQVQAMKPYAEYMLASEELEPGKGWDYSALEEITKNPSATGKELGIALLNRFEAHNKEPWITLSLVDLYALDDLDQALNELFTLFYTDLDSHVKTLALTRAELKSYGAPSRAWGQVGTVDIDQFARTLPKHDPSLATLAAKVQQGLSKAVVANIHGEAAQEASGIALYFPQNNYAYDGDYIHLELPALTVWKSLVDKYSAYTLIGIAPEFDSALDERRDLITDSYYMYLEGEIFSDPELLIKATATYGSYSADDKLLIYGEKPAEFDAQTNMVRAQWDGTFLEFVQGDRATPVYFKQDIDREGLMRVDIPVYYRPSGASDTDQFQHALLVYTVDSTQGEEGVSLFVTNPSGTIGEVSLDEGGRILPYIYEMDKDTFQLSEHTVESEYFDLSKPYGFKFSSYGESDDMLMINLYGFNGISDMIYGIDVY